MTLSIMVIIIMLSAFMLVVVILNVMVPRGGGEVKRPQHEQNSISSQRNTNRNRKIIAAKLTPL